LSLVKRLLKHDTLWRAFREYVLSKPQTYRQFSRFKDGQIYMENEEHCQWLSTDRMDGHAERVQELIHWDRHLTVHNLCEKINLHYHFLRRSEHDTCNKALVYGHYPETKHQSSPRPKKVQQVQSNVIAHWSYILLQWDCVS
jgi:hypothetical protein